MIVTCVPVSARKPIREPSHTLCRLLLALVNEGVKCQYYRCREPGGGAAVTDPGASDGAGKRRTAGLVIDVAAVFDNIVVVVVAVIVVARVTVLYRKMTVGTSCRPLLALGAGGIVHSHGGPCVVS